MAKQRGQIGQRPTECRLQLEIPQNKHGNQSHPDLRVYGVGAGSQECLDLQILLYGFKQRADRLPNKLLKEKS